MFEYILLGGGFAFAAAVQPGPLQAFLFSSVTQHGWKKTLPAAWAPIIGDIPIAILVLFVLNGLPGFMKPALQITGGIFLLFISTKSYLKLMKGNQINHNPNMTAPKTLLQAILVTILNPHPYIGWSLVLGPACLNAWHKNPLFGISLIASFCVMMVATLSVIIFLFGTTGKLSVKQRRNLSFASVIVLASIGVYQLFKGVFLVIW